MINFDVGACQSISQADVFGLHDPENGDQAHIDETGEVQWNCTVLNPETYLCKFTAIDNCIQITDEDGNLKRTCDGMLEYEGHVILVELKHMTKRWIPTGIDQVRQTITLLMEGRELSDYRKKIAVVANARHPRFKSGHQSTMERFRNETGFRLLIVGEIKLK